MTKPLIWSIGESLQDVISKQPGTDFAEVTEWDKQKGGAPANTLVALALQGVPVGLLGCVGNDEIGTELRSELEAYGVNTVGLITVANQTRIAYVLLNKNGDRQFHHFSENCADEQHSGKHLPDCFPGTAKILHCGTISLRVEPAASTTRSAIKMALLAKLIISLDVNYRDVLWPNEEAFRDCVLSMINDIHILKMTEEELRLVTLDRQTPSLELATVFRAKHLIPLLLITLGSEGSIAINQNGALVVPTIKIKSVDSTGAGDAFNAGILAGIIRLINQNETVGLDPLTIVKILPSAHLAKIVERANVLGALSCTRFGAWSALPTAEELSQFLADKD